jgi:hypothetical protein
MQNSLAVNEQAVLEPTADERRRHKRKPVLWKAVLDTGSGPAECAILDLSLGGAKLRVAATGTQRQRVTLVIDRFGPLEAEVIWSRSGRMGVRFTAAPEIVAGTIGAALPLSGR